MGNSVLYGHVPSFKLHDLTLLFEILVERRVLFSVGMGGARPFNLAWIDEKILGTSIILFTLFTYI